MCLAAVYLGTESVQPILKEVAYIRVHDGAVELETLFGEKELLQRKLQEIDFIHSRIIME
jgi:predicted RNA-binding protein